MTKIQINRRNTHLVKSSGPNRVCKSSQPASRPCKWAPCWGRGHLERRPASGPDSGILEESQGDFFICSPGSWRHGRRRGSHGPWPIHMGRLVVCTSYAGIWSSEGMKTLSSTEKLCPMSHKSLHWVTLHCEVLTIFSGHSLRTLFGRRFWLLEAQLCPTFCSSSSRFSDDFHKSKK